jgi:hypothetical protein
MRQSIYLTIGFLIHSIINSFKFLNYEIEFQVLKKEREKEREKESYI